MPVGRGCLQVRTIMQDMLARFAPRRFFRELLGTMMPIAGALAPGPLALAAPPWIAAMDRRTAALRGGRGEPRSS